MKFAPVMLSWCSIIMLSFFHDKSSSVSQFISGKSRNLQKLLKYLSWIAVSTFKAGTADCGDLGGCCGWDPSRFGDGCGSRGGLSGFCGVFPTIFVLYLNDLSSEALSSTSILSL